MVAVLAILLVGADFGAAAFAEHTVSQKARDSLGLSDDPSVSINGFPFLTQAIGGDYGHITVHAGGVPVNDELREVALTADLRNVDAPLSDLTSGNLDSVNIGELEGQARVKASDIARVGALTKIDNLKIKPASEAYVRHGEDANGEDGTTTKTTQKGESAEGEESSEDSSAGLQLSGSAQVAGQKVDISAYCLIELEGSSINITPERLELGNGQESTLVQEAAQDQLLPNFKATIDVGNLPFKVTPTGVDVEDGNIVVKGKAKNVTFTGVEQGSATVQSGN